jgi:hypothetical protein
MNREILFSNKVQFEKPKKIEEFDSLNSPPNTIRSQCYADHFCGGGTHINGASEFYSCCAFVKFISQRR